MGAVFEIVGESSVEDTAEGAGVGVGKLTFVAGTVTATLVVRGAVAVMALCGVSVGEGRRGLIPGLSSSAVNSTNVLLVILLGSITG